MEGSLHPDSLLTCREEGLYWAHILHPSIHFIFISHFLDSEIALAITIDKETIWDNVRPWRAKFVPGRKDHVACFFISNMVPPRHSHGKCQQQRMEREVSEQ